MKTLALSPAAVALFRRHVETRRTLDLEKNRDAYRELARWADGCWE